MPGHESVLNLNGTNAKFGKWGLRVLSPQVNRYSYRARGEVLEKWQKLCVVLLRHALARCRTKALADGRKHTGASAKVLATPCLASVVPDQFIVEGRVSNPSAADVFVPTATRLASSDVRWRKYKTPQSGKYWWSNPEGTNWFMEEDSTTWNKFASDTGRTWWHSWFFEDEWFFEDTGRQT